MKRERKNHRYLNILLFLSLLFLAGCSKEDKNDLVSGPSFSKEEDDIWVTLQTDKAEYKEGEEVKYSLSVENNKKGYTISRVYAQNSNQDVLAESEVPSFSGVIKTGETKTYEGSLKSASLVENPGELKKEAISGSVETITIRPYVTIKYADEEVNVRYVCEIVMYQEKVEISSEDKKVLKTVSCHDPSIVTGEDKEGNKCYYIFGSHRAWAKSYDLQNWETFKNNLSTDYSEILKEAAAWSAHGSSNYKVDGYMWAPDVIYNTSMGKWCMYMSVDGDNWYSSIVLLTADSLEGDWTYEGIVVYSGFRTDEYYDETDVSLATGETERNERYDKNWGNNYPNNIDPCVFYDDEGNLWMSYGSWSGGIFMLELDEETGFRDYSVKYEESEHSDPYFGTKIAGGQYVSGEASYIQKIGDYYWLFISYGGLEAKGGYNVRVFRSKIPNGDYVDELGNTPFFDQYSLNINSSIGVRLFGGYKWRSFTVGQVAQGHNSAFVDDDGKAYIVFHTRTTDGSEGHYVKVHQLFLNEDDWLVSAPYQTMGESLKDGGYETKDLVGEYDIILHSLNIEYGSLEVNKTKSISLLEDGKVTGDLEGSYSLDENLPYLTLTVDGVNYKGIILEMDMESTSIKTLTFSLLGDSNQITLWGSRMLE